MDGKDLIEFSPISNDGKMEDLPPLAKKRLFGQKKLFAIFYLVDLGRFKKINLGIIN